MTEVVVHDVIVRVPKGEEAKWLAAGKDYKLGALRVVLLKERSGDRILPIWIGAIEGDVIAMRLENLATERPTTFDLTARLIETGGMKLEKVAVTALRGKIYYATMWLNAGGAVHEVDARPSDAIMIALLTNSPIFVSEETWKAFDSISAAANTLEVLEEQNRKAIAEGIVQPDPAEMEYRSYRSLPRGEIPGIKASGKPTA